MSAEGSAAVLEPEQVRVRWDEEAIAEHDKLRGTRMKIIEPKTPYRKESFSDASGDEEEQCTTSSVPKKESAAVALGAAAEKLATNFSPPAAAAASKKEDFKAARKKHYNEFEMLKKWREAQKDEDDGEDED